MNVLLTCAGARTYLLGALRAALGGGGRVLACDASADAPALQLADQGFLVPDVTDPAYLGTLLELCRRERVDLLLPSLEHELHLLASHRDEFASAGTLALVSAPDVVETCEDKLAASAFLEACEIAVPRTWTCLEGARESIARGELAFPVVVKPRRGVSSIGLAVAGDDDELALSWRMARRTIDRSAWRLAADSDHTSTVLIQAYVTGIEYGFDVVNDLEGRYVATFVRRKLRMRAGQTDRAETQPAAGFEAVGKRIGERLGHVGILDCDAIVTDSNCVVLDMNPRIGGGYPFSHLAGANFPAALVAWIRGERPEPEWMRAAPYMTGARHDGFLLLDDRREPGLAPLESTRTPFISQK
jgi:carbamoyl-phosphate synthase large subunit